MTTPEIQPPSEYGRRVSSVAQTVCTVLLFAAALFVVQRLTFQLRFPPFQRTPIWTPGAILYTALLLAPARRWWIYYVGLCLGTLAAFSRDSEIPVTSAMLAAQFLFAAVALGAWGIRRFGVNPLFGSPTALLQFVAIAVALVPLSVTVPLSLAQFASGAEEVWRVEFRSFFADALGTLIATPALALTIANGFDWLRAASLKKFAEIAILAACVATVSYFVFETTSGSESIPALVYAPLPLLLWAAMRFGLAGVSWALLGIAIQSTWGAIHGRGPFTSSAPTENVLHLQTFLITISLPLMFLAAAIQERGRALSALYEEVTERKRSEERFRLVVESAPSAIVMVSATGEIILVNYHCEELFIFSRDELVGQSVEILIPERFRQEHPGHRADFFASPSARPMGAGRELFGRRKDGSEFPVEIGLTPIQTDAGLLVLSVIVDISERKRAEEIKHDMAHASRLAIVGELTASIAHEINQPLGAILSNVDAAELLLESSSASLDEVRQILDDIRKDDVRASEVIRRLRALMRKREIEMQSIDINELISGVLWLVHAESRRRGITVETVLEDDLPNVRGDKVQLQQVILNLILNGMEAMSDLPDAKRLTVSTVLNDDGRVEVAVSDAGHGIPPAQLPRMFEAFYSTKKEGMGLGLSIARSIVESHGGRVGAENSPSGGAIVRFTLPIEMPQPPNKTPEASRAFVEEPA